MQGSGTEQDPYLVETAVDLDNVRNDMDAIYVQIADIDLFGYGNWDPIGGSYSSFTGVYDGDFYEIKNLTCKHGESGLIDDEAEGRSIGLFATVHNATIKKIVLRNFEVEGNSRVGGIVGSQLHSSGDLEECYLYDGSVTGLPYWTDDDDTLRGHHIGGLVGHAVCNLNHHEVNNVDVKGPGRVGGLVGLARNFVKDSVVRYGSVKYTDEILELWPPALAGIAGHIGDYLLRCYVTETEIDISEVSGIRESLQDNEGGGAPPRDSYYNSLYGSTKYDEVDIDGGTTSELKYPFKEGLFYTDRWEWETWNFKEDWFADSEDIHDGYPFVAYKYFEEMEFEFSYEDSSKFEREGKAYINYSFQDEYTHGLEIPLDEDGKGKGTKELVPSDNYTIYVSERGNVFTEVKNVRFEEGLNSLSVVMEKPIDYEITNPEELFMINFDGKGDFIIQNDIDLEYFEIPDIPLPEDDDTELGRGIIHEYREYTGFWFPLGDFHYSDLTAMYESGASIDGNDNVIKNMTIGDGEKVIIPRYAGLISESIGETKIENIIFEDCEIVGFDGDPYYAGIAIGFVKNTYSAGKVLASKIIAKDCKVKNVDTVAGGLIGSISADVIVENCSFEGEVVEGDYSGGLVGWGEGNIINCYAKTDVKGKWNQAGIQISWADEIKHCYFVGKFLGDGNTAPIAYDWGYDNIDTCYYDKTEMNIEEFDTKDDDEIPATTKQLTFPYDRGSKPEEGEEWEDYWVEDDVEGWELDTEYEMGDKIHLDIGDNLYLSKQDHTSTEESKPGEGEEWEDYWEEIVENIYHGIWEEGFYNGGDVVFYNETYYNCLEDHLSTANGVYEGWDIDERAR